MIGDKFSFLSLSRGAESIRHLRGEREQSEVNKGKPKRRPWLEAHTWLGSTLLIRVAFVAILLSSAGPGGSTNLHVLSKHSAPKYTFYISTIFKGNLAYIFNSRFLNKQQGFSSHSLILEKSVISGHPVAVLLRSTYFFRRTQAEGSMTSCFSLKGCSTVETAKEWMWQRTHFREANSYPSSFLFAQVRLLFPELCR